MKIKKIVYSPLAVEQLVYKFNNNNNTEIELINTDYADGTSFVTLDIKEISIELIYDFAYQLGSLEKYLAMKGDSWLPLDEYPFPPEKEE
ncbi:hypothetical protein [uncultured Tenacibaculum sp.]|uniref:hypothetical protein n=1 Tax=uncultured Tenacibaculum sp. TaxID=174713 RepID=UPI002610F236|nr:hypothetical protein [uncultured Tenacibaculum sp.]